MLKKILSTLLIISMLCTMMPLSGVFAAPNDPEAVIYYDDFETGYDPATGEITIPNGFEFVNDARGRVFTLTTEGTNTYLNVYDEADTSTLHITKPATLESGNEFAVKLRIRSNKTDSLSDLANNGEFFRIEFSNPSSYQYINFKNHKITAFGSNNTASLNGAHETSGYTTVAADNWYDVVYVSKIVNGAQRSIVYVDGVYQGYYEGYIDANAQLDGLSIYQSTDRANHARSYDYDDITLYDPSYALNVVSANVTDGATEVSEEGPFAINFTAPVDPATLTNVLKKGDIAEEVDITFTDGDMTKAIITPKIALTKGETYKLDFTGVTDVVGKAITTTPAIEFTTVYPDLVVYGEDFEGENEVDAGTHVPTGFTCVNTAGLTNRAFSVETEADGNKYLRLADTGSTSSMEVKYPVAGIGTDFVFRTRVRTDLFASNGQVFSLYFDEKDNDAKSGGYKQDINFKDGRGLIAVGTASTGTPNYVNSQYTGAVAALKDRPSLVMPLETNVWYDVVVVSETVGEAGALKKKLSFYVDGVFQGYLDDFFPATAQLTHIGFYSLKTTGYSECLVPGTGGDTGVPAQYAKTYDYDDIELYSTYRHALLTKDTTATGSENVAPKDVKLNYTFNSPVDASASVLKKNSTPIDAEITAVNGNMKNISVVPAEGWQYEASYEFTLNADNLVGGAITDTVAFTTKAFNDGGDDGTVAHKLFIAGDSTAAKNPYTAVSETVMTGWGDSFAKFTTDKLEVVNVARGGAQADTFITMNDEGRGWLAFKDDIADGDYVLFQFGHNDAALREKEDGTVETVEETLADYEAALRTMIEFTLEKGAIPVLASITPNIRGDEFSLSDEKAPFMEVCKKLAYEYELTFLPINTLANAMFNGSLATEAASDGIIWGKDNDGKTDGIHLSPYGAYEIASVVAEAVCDSQSSLKNYIVKDFAEPAYFDADGSQADFTESGVKFAKIYAKGINTSALLIGTYNNNSFVNAAVKSAVSFTGSDFVGRKIDFTPSSTATSAKLFVWESLANLKPLLLK